MTSISSRKEGILGHACVNLYNETEIRITDLSSSNGTFWTGLAEKEAYDFIDRLSEGRDTTLTKEYNSSVTMKKNLNRIDNEFNSIEYPVFIRLGTNTNFLLL